MGVVRTLYQSHTTHSSPRPLPSCQKNFTFPFWLAVGGEGVDSVELSEPSAAAERERRGRRYLFLLHFFKQAWFSMVFLS